MKGVIKIVYVLIAAVIAICLAEGIPLVKKKLWKELVALGLLVFISMILLTGKMLGIQTPFGMLYNLLSPIGKVIFKHE